MAVSTICILWLLWLCKTKQASRGVVYWLATYDDVKDFVNTKVDPLLRENDTLKQNVTGTISRPGSKDTWNVGLKNIFGTDTFWRGLKSPSKVKSISADADIFDEFDESDPSNVKQAEQRTSASTVKLRRKLSTPTIPDYGINAAFKETDQCHFAFKCEHCSTWNVLEENFPNCFQIDPSTNKYFHTCQKCKKALNIQNGTWITKRHSPIRGFQISQLYSPFITPDQIMHEYNTTQFMGHFYNHVLGLPYLSATDKVSFEQVLTLCQPQNPMPSNSIDGTYLGIDQGSKLHCVITTKGTPSRILWAGELVHFEDVDSLMLKYNVKQCVIDALPETRKARELMMRNKNKVWLCFYNDNQKGSYAWKEDERIVSVNRTESLDVGTNALLESRILLPRRDSTIEELAKHFSNIVKTIEENKDTRSRRYVYKALGPDHYRHAFNYSLIAGSRQSFTRPISIFR